MMKKMLTIFLIVLIVLMIPISAMADTLGKRQKTPAESKAENEKKIQVEESDGTPVNLIFKHGKYNKTPSADVKAKGQSVSSGTNYAIIADIRYGKMCLFVYQGRKNHRKLVKVAPCSSATNISGTKTSRTPSGSHRITWKTNRLVYTNKDGRKWQYWSCSMTPQGWGIHTLTYCLKATSKRERKYLWGGILGVHNSPACLRTENWLADWIYGHCGIGTVIYVIR